MNAADFDKLDDEEKQHFYRCAKCGEFVDKRELRDVIFHETDHKPKPHIPRIIGNSNTHANENDVRVAQAQINRLKAKLAA